MRLTDQEKQIDFNWNTNTFEMEIRDPQHPTYVPLCGNRCWALIPTNLDWYCYDVDLPNWIRILKRIGVYLQINDTPGPVTKVLEDLKTFYGANYLRLTGSREGIAVEIKVYPNAEESFLYFTVSLENTASKIADVRVLFGADFELHPAPGFCRGFTEDATQDASGMGRKYNALKDDMIKANEDGSIFIVSDPTDCRIGFVASDAPTGWMLNRCNFSFETPLSGNAPNRIPCPSESLRLTNDKESNDSLCAFLHRFSLEPGQKRQIPTVFGYQSAEDTHAITEALKSSEQAFEKTKNYYQMPLVKGVQIETPDPVINAQFNIYNIFMKLNEHHTSSKRAFLPAMHYYNWICGDSFAVLPAYCYTNDLGPVIDSIDLYKRSQRKDGCIPQLPLWTDGESWREPEVSPRLEGFFYMDAVCQFIKITQDKAFAENIFSSIKGGLDYLLVNEKEGLIFPGGDFSFDAIDWPVGFGHCPQTFSSCAAYKMMMDLRDISRWLGNKEYADELLTKAEKLKKTINKKLWMEDRGHYRVGLVVDGKAGKDERDAELFSHEMVSWGTLVAVLWGVAEGDRAQKALRTVKERLYTPYGLRFFDPIWSPSYTDVKGHVSEEAGRMQNGGYWHCWWSTDTFITSQILSGNIEEGLDALHDIRLDTTYDRFKMTEKGKEMSFIRSGEWTDTDMTFPVTSIPYTVTAGFFNQMLLEAILGIHVEYGSLRIEPHLPVSWDKATVSNLTIGDSVWTIEMRRNGTPPKILLDSRETKTIPITSGKHLVQIML